ncbi:GTPase [Campylobacter sp. 2018MI13]|uniref:GTPase family protein n=1 Tax=Campylobacter sp. 2018MI13 TaxID=2836737 RepID=UPI001BDAC4A2|nr:GTPase [Campylobacter sp. 2018MI13]MBT0882642.1 50S ribosome-binding GTPase [Campylobacter sp. 2018MI13]
MSKDIFKELEKNIGELTSISESDRIVMLKNIQSMKNKKINVMITGATGCGKSSTINALFNTEKAKVGVGVDPETMSIEKYELDNLTLWDSPGLGDGKEKDNQHGKNIIDLLYKKDDSGNALIDLVLVILDGGSRDLGTSYKLINQVIIPALGDSAKDRILVAINQCDMAMKGRYFNYEENKPEPKLVEFLEDKVKSVKDRIKEATGVDIEPIYYSAGFKEEGMPQQRPYNLSKLLYFIVKHTPEEKRIHIAQNMTKEEEMLKDDDRLIDYNKKVKESFLGSIVKSVSKGASVGADIGGSIGSIFGSAGKAIGSAIGGAIGAIGGFIGGLFGW